MRVAVKIRFNQSPADHARLDSGPALTDLTSVASAFDGMLTTPLDYSKTSLRGNQSFVKGRTASGPRVSLAVNEISQRYGRELRQTRSTKRSSRCTEQCPDFCPSLSSVTSNLHLMKRIKTSLWPYSRP